MTSEDLTAVVRQITDQVIPPVTLEIGKRYLHPDDGEIEITGGCYRDPRYGRISNYWSWWIMDTDMSGSGYGANWPEVK